MQHILTDHSYLALFFALLLGGETILLPAVYFALLGKTGAFARHRHCRYSDDPF